MKHSEILKLAKMALWNGDSNRQQKHEFICHAVKEVRGIGPFSPSYEDSAEKDIIGKITYDLGAGVTFYGLVVTLGLFKENDFVGVQKARLNYMNKLITYYELQGK